MIASVGYDGYVRVWDAVTGTESGALRTTGASPDLNCVAMNQNMVAAGGEEGIFRTPNWILFLYIFSL